MIGSDATSIPHSFAWFRGDDTEGGGWGEGGFSWLLLSTAFSLHSLLVIVY